MARLRTNNVFGTITNNPLLIGGTTLSGAGLANLVAVTAPDVAVITLDPNRVHGAPEIVYVTAHTAANTSATILRGQEGTAAREHPNGTFWVHGATALDSERVWDPPACRVHHSAVQSIPNNTETPLLFNSKRYDTDSMHSTSVNTSRITLNTAGLYVVSGNIQWAANATGPRQIGIRLNGGTYLAIELDPSAGASIVHQQNVTTVYKFAATNYVELVAYQASGAALNSNAAGNYSPEFSATWIGSGD